MTARAYLVAACWLVICGTTLAAVLEAFGNTT